MIDLVAENAPISLDALDSRILAALQEDGRLSNVELAERVGLSPSPCLRRVKRLEEEGYIAGYKAKVDRRRLGLGMTVFVGVKFDSHRDANAAPSRRRCRRLPEVVACHMVSGEADFLLEVVVADLAAYDAFLSRTSAQAADGPRHPQQLCHPHGEVRWRVAGVARMSVSALRNQPLVPITRFKLCS